MREACAHVRNSPPSRVPSLEKLLAPTPFIAVDRVSLRTDFDMDNPEHTGVVIANNKVVGTWASEYVTLGLDNPLFRLSICRFAVRGFAIRIYLLPI